MVAQSASVAPGRARSAPRVSAAASPWRSEPSPSWTESTPLYERIVELEARLDTTARPLTISHGDCYLTQWLCPRSPGASGAFLIDFDSVSANYAAYDLVYLLATFWTSAQRRDEGHELEALMLFDPIHDAVAGASEHYWRNNMQCLVGAL